jgi:DNA-binding MarR family transcriptional regulator
MSSRIIPKRSRTRQIEYVSHELLPQAALLSRLVFRELGGDLSRTEVGLLRTVSEGPRRITELADLEGLAQPTMTILIKRLEQQGLVKRERRSEDGRVVLVDITQSGRAALNDYRQQVSEAIGGYLAEISDAQINALVAATKTLAQFVTVVRQQPTRRTARRDSPRRQLARVGKATLDHHPG